MKIILAILAALAIGAGSLKAGDPFAADPIRAAQFEEFQRERAYWATVDFKELMKQREAEAAQYRNRYHSHTSNLESRISELESKVESLEADR
jgi:hypothetical protein